MKLKEWRLVSKQETGGCDRIAVRQKAQAPKVATRVRVGQGRPPTPWRSTSPPSGLKRGGHAGWYLPGERQLSLSRPLRL